MIGVQHSDVKGKLLKFILDTALVFMRWVTDIEYFNAFVSRVGYIRANSSTDSGQSVHGWIS